jgi:hypothetical protein
MTNIIIPTPRQLTCLPGASRHWKRGAACRMAVSVNHDAFAVRFLAERLRQQFGLRVTVKALSDDENADVILCGDGDRRVATLLPENLSQLDGLAREQGYALHSTGSGPSILYAHTSIGLLYAGATLLQLLQADGQSTHLPNVMVKDWPEFRYRGNSWLIHAERFGWSYARGDGLPAYEQRVLRKLDLCALHKINFLYFDGFDFELNSFPGHCAMMRRLNREAGWRGIRLSFGGHGTWDEGYQNRRVYPSGPTYPCMGYVNDERSRHRGTCLSNPQLIRLRQERLTRFVERIRPGAIYLHSMDTGRMADSRVPWSMRCPSCRDRWPNENVEAPDGMAGAFAAFYDAMALAIRRADPDCMLVVVSPCYAHCEEPDAEWRSAGRYWLTVSQQLRDRELLIGLREQFVNHESRRLRYAALRDNLDRHANGHRIFSLHFFGGDCFYNSHGFLATPILNHYFQGAEAVVNGNGTAYQEPQQLFNAECLWNPLGSRYFTPPPIEPYPALRRRYVKLCRGEERPPLIFGRFLDDACARLYGAKAGRLVARIYCLSGKTRLKLPATERYRFDRASVWLSVHNYLHPTVRAFRHGGVVWEKDLDEGRQARIRRLGSVYREVVAINQQAERLARRAANHCAEPSVAGDLRWMADTLRAARRIAKLLPPFLDLFLRAHRAVRTGRGQASIRSEISRFARRLTAYERPLKRAFHDARVGDEAELLSRRDATVRLRHLLTQIERTFINGTWPT